VPVETSRRAYIDWARGIAVLLMIEAHTFDAWTRVSARASRSFAYSAMLGGFAAPLFLWLAGVGVALSAASISRRSGDRQIAVENVCRRGLEIFVLAFVFRLQSFFVTPGSYPVTIFRVDILNVMGPGIVFAGLLWALDARASRLAMIYSLAACLVAMVTPLLRAAPALDTLPTWIQWYLRPSGDYTTFTLFPWTGFVLAGAACGVLLAESTDADADRRLHVGLAVAGAMVLALGFYTASRPSIYVQSAFWTSSPTFFAIRVGIMTIGLALLFALSKAMRARTGLRALERFGKSSLFVYWVHVELVYGYATWPLRHRLPIWGTLLAFLVFTVLMYGAISARDRLAGVWRKRAGRMNRQNAPVIAESATSVLS